METYDNDYLRCKLTDTRSATLYSAVRVDNSGLVYPNVDFMTLGCNFFAFVPDGVIGSTVSTKVLWFCEPAHYFVQIGVCDVVVDGDGVPRDFGKILFTASFETDDGMDNLERDVLTAAQRLVDGGTLSSPDGSVELLTASEVVRCCKYATYGDAVNATYDYMLRVRGLRMLDEDLRA